MASFIDGLRKTQWWRYHNVSLCCWDLKISNFVRLYTGYQPSKFQISWLSGSNFIEISVKHQKHHYDVICYHWVSKLAYFVEHDISYQPSKFQCSRLSGSNFTEGGGKHTSPVLQRDKKPSAYRVKTIAWYCKSLGGGGGGGRGEGGGVVFGKLHKDNLSTTYSQSHNRL